MWSVDKIPSQSGKIALVTGANSGIGFEAAKVLVSKGAEVILACRNVNKGEEALAQIKSDDPDANVHLMTLDLASLSSVKEFSEAFTSKYQKLDLLINNAGVMAPPFGRTADGFEMQFGTNHLGHFALTGHLLPLLEAADSARIVIVSSLAHRFGRINFNNLNSEKRYSRWVAYGQSKLANLMFAKEIQRRLESKGSDIVAVAVHPGFSATNLQRYMPGATWMNSLFSQSQEAGCLPTLFAATEANIRGGEYIGPDGFFEMKGNPRNAFATNTSGSRSKAKKLWDESERLTNVAYLSVA